MCAARNFTMLGPTTAIPISQWLAYFRAHLSPFMHSKAGLLSVTSCIFLGAEDRSDLATELHKTTALAMKTYCQVFSESMQCIPNTNY